MSKNAKLVMLEHSRAKVELYSTYLSTFLTVLSKAKIFETIHIYDLMCGEGIYEDDSEGSPIVALKKINEHYYSNKRECPNIILWFNDKDYSQIEPEKLKIDRVREQCSKMFRPDNVFIKYTKKDIVELLPFLQFKTGKLKSNERLLLFIDPYGYKEIGPSHLKQILKKKQVELIFFVPISNMHRFARKALEDNTFAGGEAIRKFLSPLLEYGFNINNASTKGEFIDLLRTSLRAYLDEHDVFVDTFALERDKANTYCLFFFTHHIRGFQKMLEVKWKLDTDQGRGFTIAQNSNQFTLFENPHKEYRVSKYTEELEKEINVTETFTNSDLFLFGLSKGFLPKQSNEILRYWQKNRSDFVVLENDGITKARKNSFYNNYDNYIDSPKKPKIRVIFKFKANV